MKKIKFIVAMFFTIAISSSCKKTTCNVVEQDTFPYKCETGMDVAFVVDYTGSMGYVIDSIKTNINSIANTIIAKSGGDYRLSLSIFDETNKGGTLNYLTKADYLVLPAPQKIKKTTGTTHDQYLTMMEKFNTANKISFNAQLAKLNTVSFPIGWGMTTAPEPGGMLADVIINSAFAGAWRPFKNKFVIIITDDVDGGDDGIANPTDDTFLTNLASLANVNGVQCILVTSQPTVASNYSLKLIANNTGAIQATSANLQNIAPLINQMINNICENNGK
ncbi:MAG: hypothetical protein ABL929_10180 [Ferruginibacter sp.]|nr:hypothetical protein [Ferruginibacter sp.]